MNIYTFKLSKKLIITVALSILLLIALIILIIPKGDSKATSAAAIKGMSDKEDLTDYLESLGYEVSETVWKSRQVVVPRDFDNRSADSLLGAKPPNTVSWVLSTMISSPSRP